MSDTETPKDKDPNDFKRRVNEEDFAKVLKGLRGKAPKNPPVYFEIKDRNTFFPAPEDWVNRGEKPKRKPESLVPGLFHEREIILFSAASKGRKTYIGINLAISIATGQPFLGFNIPRPGRVLYLDFELDPYWFEARGTAIEEALGFQIPANSFIKHHLRDYPLGDEGITALVDLISKRYDPGMFDLVIIDPLYLVLGDLSEMDSGDMIKLRHELARLRANLQCAVWVNHHFTKGNSAGKKSIDKSSGSGVLGRAVDVSISMSEHAEPGHVVMDYDFRNQAKMEPIVFRWNEPVFVRDTSGLDPTNLLDAQKKFTKDEPDPDKEPLEIIPPCFSHQSWISKSDAVNEYLPKKLGRSKKFCEKLFDRFLKETKIPGDAQARNLAQFSKNDAETYCTGFTVKWERGLKFIGNK